MTDDLVAFLRARLDEDERIAQEAGGAAWEELPVSGWVHTSTLPASERLPPGYDHHVASVPLPADRTHIVRHHPARMLREVDAKRQVIKQYESIGTPPPGEFGPELSRAELGRVLRLLALPYADHPDYREEWRP